MENEIGTEIAAELGQLEAALGRFFGSLMDPWVLAQFAIVAIGIGVGVPLGARIGDGAARSGSAWSAATIAFPCAASPQGSLDRGRIDPPRSRDCHSRRD